MHVRVDEAGVAWLTLDNPSKLNAISLEMWRTVGEALARFEHDPKPTIAMITGFCLGGGMGLASSCDLRLAATGSRFGIPAARLGIGYNYAGLKRLVDLVGPAQAKRLLYSGDRFEAEEMLRIGFVDELLALENLLPRVQALTARIASNAPLSVAAAKATIDVACSDAASQADIAACCANEAACIASEDYAEGRRAFMEKRTPVFRGR